MKPPALWRVASTALSGHVEFQRFDLLEHAGRFERVDNLGVDGLIEVDLHRLRPKKRERYLGRTAAAPPSAGSVPQPICEDATTPDRVLA